MKLSLTHTQCAADVSGVTRFAGAAIRAQCIDTLTVSAQIPHDATFINIWTQGNKTNELQVIRSQLNYHSQLYRRSNICSKS